MSFPSPARIMILDPRFKSENPKIFHHFKISLSQRCFVPFSAILNQCHIIFFPSPESVNEFKNSFNFDYDSLDCTSSNAIDWIRTLLCVVCMIEQPFISTRLKIITCCWVTSFWLMFSILKTFFFICFQSNLLMK